MHFGGSGPENLKAFKLRFSEPSKRILRGSGNQNLQNAFCGAPKTQFSGSGASKPANLHNVLFGALYMHFRGFGPQNLQIFKMRF